MNAQTLDWSDIPYVLAVCGAGSLSGAARELGVNHSTVFRRIEGAEAKLGVRLFERLSHGYVMTSAGEHFYQKAQQLRDGMTSIQRELGGQDLRLKGVLTVTTTDSLLYCLTPFFSAFQEKYADVELRLLSETRSLDLMQRDADIALRPTRKPPEHWVGRKLLPIMFATYAHQGYWAAAKERPETQCRWIKLDNDLNHPPMSQITVLQKANETPVTVVSSVMGVFDMVRAGLGIAVLPCYLGESCSELIRIKEPDTAFNWDLWALAHPDIHRSARVHAFFDFAVTEISSDTFTTKKSPGTRLRASED